MNLDESIINVGLDASQSTEPLQDKVKKLALGYAGSCALLPVYDPATSTARGLYWRFESSFRTEKARRQMESDTFVSSRFPISSLSI